MFRVVGKASVGAGPRWRALVIIVLLGGWAGTAYGQDPAPGVPPPAQVSTAPAQAQPPANPNAAPQLPDPQAVAPDWHSVTDFADVAVILLAVALGVGL